MIPFLPGTFRFQHGPREVKLRAENLQLRARIAELEAGRVPLPKSHGSKQIQSSPGDAPDAVTVILKQLQRRLQESAK